MCLLLTACAVEKPVQSNPGFEDFNMTQTNETVVPIEAPGRFDKITKNGFVATLWDLMNKAVHGLFGDKGWYVVAAAVILILVFSFFGKIGAIIFFVVFAYAIMKVVT